MKLEKLKLKNFRKFNELEINFNAGLNVFVGENNAGKTAIIDAIKLILDTNSAEYNNIDIDDFYAGENELKISLIFKIENDNDGGIFLEYLTYEEDGNSKLYLTLTANKDISTRQGFIRKVVKTGKDNNGKELEYELKELLNITYLKPLRDAENELTSGRNSRLSKILQGYFNYDKNAFFKLPELQQFIEQIKNFNKNLPNNINALKVSHDGDKGFKDKIKDNYLGKISLNDKEISLRLAESNDDEQIFKNLLKKLDLRYETNGKQGLGYQNLLFMSAEMLLLDKEKDSPSKIIAIEEPEAHLHPQHQIKFLNFIKSKEDFQVFITTHSPNLASQVPIESIFYCKNDEVYPIRECKISLNSDNIEFLEKFLDTTKSDLFFAKGLIFVEGISEQLVLPEIAKIMDFKLEENGVSIINLGNTSFKRFANIFKDKDGGERIKIPIAFVRDFDCEYNEEAKKFILTNKSNTKEYNTRKERDKELKEDLESENSDFHKVFISDDRTFEYDWFNTNKTLLIEAIKNTYIKEEDKLNEDNTIDEVYGSIQNRGKSEVAYELAKLLEEIDKENLEKYIPEYLINAINHIKSRLENKNVQ